MRLEELSLGAFITGTAIGYLIWHWVRGQDQEPQADQPHDRANGVVAPPRPPETIKPLKFTAAMLLIYLLALVGIALVFVFGTETSTPKSILEFAGHFGWMMIVAALITMPLAVGLLVVLKPRSAPPSRYRGALRTTLACTFAVILIVFTAIMIWGPHSVYLHPIGSQIAAVPLGSLLLGILFGSIGGEWLSYLMSERNLNTTLEAQHKRWGVVLSVLLFLGVIYPYIPQFLGKLSSTNITTPLGGVTFSSEPISIPRQKGSEPKTTDQTREAKTWPDFKLIGDMAERDQKYAEFFYREHRLRPRYNSLARLHADAKMTIDDILLPLAKCVEAHFERFNNRGLIRQRFADATVDYTNFLRDKQLGIATEDPTINLAKATTALSKDLKTPDNDCKKATDSIEKSKSLQLQTPLPYLAMGLSFLLYDSGESEQAMREIATWISDHYSSDKEIKACNSNQNKLDEKIKLKCDYFGYFAESEPGKEKQWFPLPAWYRVRADFELNAMLMSTVNRRITFSIARNLVRAIESLFSDSQIKSAYDWARCSSNVIGDSSDRELQSRMVVAYLTQVDLMLRNLIRVVEEGLTDDEATISPEMIRYAEDNSAVDLRCLSYFVGREPIRSTYMGFFRATYGILLTKVIAEREASGTSTDVARAGRNETIMKARTALNYAIPILRQISAEQNNRIKDRRLEERLFVLLEEEDVLRRAESALRALDEMAR